MKIAIGILIILVCILTLYIILLQRQLRNINQQLDRRLTGDSKQAVSIELFNHELNRLIANMNQCFKAEEIIRLETIRKEQRFKELIANISHDLRTPLTAIKGYQQLMGKGELTESQRMKLQIANKHAYELGILIEHFFEYSYLVNAEQKMKLEKIHLTNLVTECLATAVTTFEENGLSIRLMEAPMVFVLADQEMLIRIVENLIRNGISHAAGDVDVKITVLKNAVLTFKNTVKNVEDMDVNRMFDRFYTGDRARSKTTGLGLSIVKLLAEQMGGTANASLAGNELTIQVEIPWVGK